MRDRMDIGWVLCLVAAAAVGLHAQTDQLAEGEAATLDQRINAVSAERAELFIRVQEREQRTRDYWRDPRYTSGEIDALRTRLLALERELFDLRAEIRRNVDELPEVKTELAELRAWQERLRELTAHRDALLRQRPAAPTQ